MALVSKLPVFDDGDDDADGEEAIAHLRHIADTWRKRLSDPLVQQSIKQGIMAISPLVRDLLQAMPPQSTAEQIAQAAGKDKEKAQVLAELVVGLGG